MDIDEPITYRSSVANPSRLQQPKRRTVEPADHASALRSNVMVIDEPVLNTRQRAVYLVLAALWCTANVFYWRWWTNPTHILDWPLFVLATCALSYDLTLMPLVFVFFLWKMKRPLPIPAPPGLRVAMLTAIVPSAESLDVLEQTLAGMTAVRYPHDNWVLDEGGDPRVRDLCARYGAHYWTRAGIPEFNQRDWPFQAKTKSGNYNSWFSQVGYDRYDYFVQLDTDHIPVPSYLDDVLGYFQDPAVAYVALPSVYRNIEDWPARGSSEQSQVFQGPLQMGYYGWAKSPMIIGSHAAYRMRCVKEIGGFAPSRAEDHLDTLMFAKRGYRGVFVSKILAEGLGPHTLNDYLAQEHQWAYSIAQVLFKFGRRKERLTFRQRTVFLFSEIWYFVYSLTFLTLFVLPLLALVFGRPIVNAPFPQFMLHSIPCTLGALAILIWAYRQRWFRPGNHFFISWQGILLSMARWPIVLVAIVGATYSVLFRGGRFTYLVTPKGGRHSGARPVLQAVIPFIVLATLPIAVIASYISGGHDPHGSAAGYILFALLSSAYFTAILLAASASQIRIALQHGRGLMSGASAFLLLAFPLTLVVGIGLSFGISYHPMVAALTYRRMPITPVSQQVASDRLGLPGVTLQSRSISAAAVPQPPVSSWLLDPTREGITFGAYDPSQQLMAESSVEHLFIAWQDNASGGIPVDQIGAAATRGQIVLLTDEPWPLADRSTGTLLTDITAGRYDDIIDAQARAIHALGQPLLLRFGQEMDIPQLYPWSGQPPATYIAAYRHVVDRFRADGSANILWVWSPSGALDALSYYPGDAYVDYVGTTILEATVWETQAGFTTPRPLRQLVAEKYGLLAPLGKPIIIAELGVDLPTDLKTAALSQLFDDLHGFPLLRAAVYFDAPNPPNVLIQGVPPDWTLSPADIGTVENAIARASWVEPPPATAPPAGPDSSR